MPSDIEQRINTGFGPDADRAYCYLCNYPVDYRVGLSQHRVWRSIIVLAGADIKVLKKWVDRALLNPEKVVRKAEFGDQKASRADIQLYNFDRRFDEQDKEEDEGNFFLNAWDKLDWTWELVTGIFKNF